VEGRSVQALITTTGTLAALPASCCRKARPPRPGMRMSVNTSCGAPSASAASAGSAAANSRTASPAAASARASTKRTERPSSTIHTSGASLILVLLLVPVLRCLGQRQQQREHGVAGARAVAQRAAVLARHLLRQRQSQAGALGAAGHQWQEDALGQLLRH